MLTVQPVLDVFVNIDLIYDLVGIILEGRGEDHDLVEFGHQLDEVHAARADQEIAVTAVFNIVDQCLIKIKYESVGAMFSFTFKGWKEGWADFGKVLEIVRELRC